MKKTTMFLSILFLGLVIGTVGCKKKEAEGPTNGSATISGLVYAELNDRANAPAVQFAPAGTKIIASINSQQLSQNPTGGAYGTIQYETTVAADGSYTLTVDANATTVNVTIAPQDFIYNKLTTSFSTGSDTTIRTIYSTGSTFVSVVNGSNKIQDLGY